MHDDVDGEDGKRDEDDSGDDNRNDDDELLDDVDGEDGNRDDDENGDYKTMVLSLAVQRIRSKYSFVKITVVTLLI